MNKAIEVDVDKDIENFKNKELKGQISDLQKANVNTKTNITAHKKYIEDTLARYKGFVQQSKSYHCFRCNHFGPDQDMISLSSVTSQQSKKDKDNKGA